MSEPIISIKNVSKAFRLPHERKSSLKEAVIHFKKPSYETFTVLRDISFDIKPGEFFGILGRNGSGKSTMLKLLAGIYEPTAGDITVDGTLTPFIELGVGFNMELTGRENVFLNGAILGLTQKEIEQKYNEIVSFAELERFMDQKLKNYSSGMQVRLAFSIAIQAHNQILLVDEVLAVGDINFQEKCFRTFEEIKRSDKTVVFISHDLGAVQRFCDRVAIIDQGELIGIGKPQEMALQYMDLMAEDAVSEELKEERRHGTGDIRTTSVVLLDDNGKKMKSVQFNQPFTIRVAYKKNTPVDSPVLGIAIKNERGEDILGPNTEDSRIDTSRLGKTGYIDVHFTATNINPGRYSVTAGWFKAGTSSTKPYDYADSLAEFKIIGKARHGAIYIEPDWNVA